MKPVEIAIDDELREASNEVTHELRENKQREMVNSLDLSKCVQGFKRQGPKQLPQTMRRLTIDSSLFSPFLSPSDVTGSAPA